MGKEVVLIPHVSVSRSKVIIALNKMSGRKRGETVNNPWDIN